MPRVLVSSGHTTKDPGTIVNGIREVDVNRAIAKEVTTLLRKNNILTVAVPPDLDLVKRIEWINQMGYDSSKGDIVIEVHVNDGRKQGVEGWYKANDERSRSLTTKLVNNISKQVNWPSQGVKSEYEHPMGSLAFLHNTHPISSLLECGYLDNPNDLKILTSDDGVSKIAHGIVNGLLEFLNINKKSESNEVINGQEVQSKNTFKNNSDSTAISIDSGNLSSNNIRSVNNQMNNHNATRKTPDHNVSKVQTSKNKFSTNSNSNVVHKQQATDMVSFNTGGVLLNSNSNVNNNFVSTKQSNNIPSAKSNPSSFSPTSNSSNTFGTFQNAGFNSNTTTTFNGAGGSTKFMTREDRKEMIKKNYLKILGREPTQSDLNYFLNISINEQDLIKRMIDSQEHADLVKASQEVVKIREEFGKQKDELLKLRVKATDQEGIIKNLNALLMQKNRVIYQLKQRLQHFDTIKRNKQARSIKRKPIYKKTFKEKVLDFLSDKLGK